MAPFISSAALMARCGSSSFAWWRPKTAITASPMNFSTTPPCRSMTSLQSREVGINHRTDVLGVELAGHGGEVDEIGEEHRHLLALTTRYGGQDGGTARPQRLKGGLDHHGTQHFPLCFEGGDGVVDSGALSQRLPKLDRRTDEEREWCEFVTPEQVGLTPYEWGCFKVLWANNGTVRETTYEQVTTELGCATPRSIHRIMPTLKEQRLYTIEPKTGGDTGRRSTWTVNAKKVGAAFNCGT